MKKILPLLCILAACSNAHTTTTTTRTKTTTKTTTSANAPEYTVYQQEVDAVVCDTSKKGDFTYCDLKGREITGIVKSKGNYISYYDNGELVNGIILYPDGKNVKHYFTQNKEGDIFTTITYYTDGSIASKEVNNKNSGTTTQRYNQGEKFNKYYDQEQVNILLEAVNS